MENTENNNSKIQIGAKVDPAIFAAVSKLAVEDDRTISYMVERLLRTNPEIREILESDVVAAGAN